MGGGWQVARWRQRAAAILAAGEKRCPRCGQTLCLAAFARSSRFLDGRQTVCRRCQREYHLTRGQPRPPRPRAAPQWPPGTGPPDRPRYPLVGANSSGGRGETAGQGGERQ